MLSARFLYVLLAFSMWSAVLHGAGAVPEANSSSGIAEFSTGVRLSGESSFTIAKAVLPGYTIRRTVPEVRLQFTVADEQGRLLETISRSDLRVLDNRMTVPRIRDFSRMEDLPLQVGVLLDVSDSVEKTAQLERQATQFFIAHTFRPQTDRVALMTFSNEVRLRQSSTGDRDMLNQALAKIPQRGHMTYLYDSVYHACLDQLPPVQDADPAQRILLLISDGEDTGSLHTLADAVSAAQRREVQIYALSVHPARRPAPGDQILKQLAESTGGRLFAAASEKDFPALFNAMEQTMRTQYAVSFQPVDQTPGFHTVQIEMAGREKLRVHARTGYFFDRQ